MTDTEVDSPIDSSYPTGAWGSASMVDVGITGAVDPNLTPDMLEMYFMKGGAIYVTTRASTAMPWSTATTVAFTMSGVNDQTPSIQPDDITLLLSSDRTGTLGGYDLFISTRLSKTAPWRTPTQLANVNTMNDDTGPNLTTDQLVMVFASTRNGSNDVFETTRATTNDPWGTITALDPLNTTAYPELHPNISPDGLTIYFQSNRTTSADLYTSTRASRTGMFAAPQPIAELNDPSASDGDPWVSPDGHHIFFSSNRSGAYLIYEASR